jgi:hypothetical protein
VGHAFCHDRQRQLSGDVLRAYIQQFMLALGGVVNRATELSPFPMGIAVAVLVGLVLTPPISSAALCIMLGSAAWLPCRNGRLLCSDDRFCHYHYRDNGVSGLLSVGWVLRCCNSQYSTPTVDIDPTYVGGGYLGTGLYLPV